MNEPTTPPHGAADGRPESATLYDPGNPVRPAEPVGWYTRDGRLRGSAEPIPGRCGRPLRGTNPPRYCKRPPMRGRDCCAGCGGKSPRGVAHYNYRGRGFSKDLPSRLRKDYEAARRDPDLLSMRENQAVLRVRTRELARRLDTGEAGPLWAELREAFQAFRKATRGAQEAARRGDATGAEAMHAGMAAALGRVGDLIDRGAANEVVWDQLAEAMEREARMAAKEWRRMVDLRLVMTAEQGLALITAVALSVKRHVKDPDALRAISRDMAALAQRPELPGVEAAPTEDGVQ